MTLEEQITALRALAQRSQMMVDVVDQRLVTAASSDVVTCVRAFKASVERLVASLPLEPEEEPTPKTAQGFQPGDEVRFRGQTWRIKYLFTSMGRECLKLENATCSYPVLASAVTRK